MVEDLNRFRSIGKVEELGEIYLLSPSANIRYSELFPEQIPGSGRIKYNTAQFKEMLKEDEKKRPEERRVLKLPHETFENWNNISGRFYISPSKNFDIARALFKDQTNEYFKWLFYLDDPIKDTWNRGELRFQIDLASRNKDNSPYLVPLTSSLRFGLDGRSSDWGYGQYCAYDNASLVRIKKPTGLRNIISSRDLALARINLPPNSPINEQILTSEFIAYIGKGDEALLIIDPNVQSDIIKVNNLLKSSH